MPHPADQPIQGRHHQQHQGTLGDQAGDDGDGQGALHGGTGSKRDGQGGEGEVGGQGGHGDGAQAIGAGLDQGPGGIDALGQEAVVFGEIENRHLGDDADYHGQAHQGHDVQLHAGQPQADPHGEGGRQGHGDDGGDDAEVLLEQQQQHGDDGQRGGEHRGQAPERLLLLCDQAAPL